MSAKSTDSVAEEPPDATPPAPGHLAPLDEMLLQNVWAQRLIAAGLRTESGRELRIVDAGTWNAAGGPDFRNAEFAIDGHPVRGDVEIHVDSSGWREHGHQGDFEYNRVVLHVFLRNNDGRRYDLLQNGEKIERLRLENRLEPDLESIRATLESELLAPGTPTCATACQIALKIMDQRLIELALDRAAKDRFESKVQRLRLSGGLAGAGRTPSGDEAVARLDQALYQGVVTYLGQGPSKPLYYLLARRAPLKELRLLTKSWRGPERHLALQSILLHVSGLLAGICDAPSGKRKAASAELEGLGGDGQTLDAEAQEYVNTLNRYWSELGGYFGDRLIAPTRRWYGGVRPVNFPTRQLAGLARLLCRWFDVGDSLAEALLQQLPSPAFAPEKFSRRELRKLAKFLTGWLEVEAPDDFWARRFTLTARPAVAPMKLIGPARAEMMCFNALLPGLVLLADETKALPEGWRDRAEAGGKLARRLYATWKALPPTGVTRHMTWRLFGDSPRARDVLVGEARMQALYQIFSECCNHRSPHGEACGTFGKPPSG